MTRLVLGLTATVGRVTMQPSPQSTTSSMTVDDWFAIWFASRSFKVAPSTLASNWSLYRLYFDDLAEVSLSERTAGRIKDFLAQVEHRCHEQQPGVGQPHTVRHCHALLAAALHDAVDHEIIATSPMTRVPRPKTPPPRPKHLSADELGRLLSVVHASGDGRALAVELMARLGLRRNEALGLTWDDVDLDHHQLHVRFQIGRVPDPSRPGSTRLVRRELKTMGSRRNLRLAGDLVDMLTAHRLHTAATRCAQDLVISLSQGRPVDPDAFTRWLTRVGRSIDVTVSPHRLRHSAATLMLNRGASIEAVAKVLGHSDGRVTSVYARVLDETSGAAVELLAGVFDEIAATNETVSGPAIDPVPTVLH